ncbi:MAG: thioredoxin family protein [Planctomycetota bacterium]
MLSRSLARLLSRPETANKRQVIRLRSWLAAPGGRTTPRIRAEAIANRFLASQVALCFLLVATGCRVARNSQPDPRTIESVSYVTVDELAASLSTDSDSTDRNVVLVEFCVPSGCPRCDEMRAPIDRLASDQGQRLEVQRVNLRREPAVAWELGVTVCPSYIAFRDGQEVFRAAYPTSAERIAAELEECLDMSPADPQVFAER